MESQNKFTNIRITALKAESTRLGTFGVQLQFCIDVPGRATWGYISSGVIVEGWCQHSVKASLN